MGHQPEPFVVATVATKGGSGKTTITANVGALLAMFGMRVLLVDADIQPSLSKYFPLTKRAPLGLTSVITRGGVVLEDCVSSTNRENLHIIVSDDHDKSLQTWLKDREDRLVILRRAFRRSSFVRENFDVVLIDTQGAYGELQKTAAMAGHIILSPINPSILSAREFSSGFLAMQKSLNSMEDFGAEFCAGETLGLIYMADRTNNAKEIEQNIRNEYRTSRSVRVLQTAVPISVAYESAATLQTAAFEIDRPSKKKASSAFQTMHELVWELFPNLKDLYFTDVVEEEEA